MRASDRVPPGIARVLARARVGAPSGAEPRGEREVLRASAEDRSRELAGDEGFVAGVRADEEREGVRGAEMEDFVEEARSAHVVRGVGVRFTSDGGARERVRGVG